jgi:DNA-binding response OmpR family regulator
MAAAAEADKLRGLRVLLVEDELLIADLVQGMLTELGCEVIGPALSLKHAQAFASDGTRIDAALLDVNIAGQQVYPFATVLSDRNIPIAFVTGSGSDGMPTQWQNYPTVQKPLDRNELAAVLKGMVK